jgi:hypothetical protein
MGFILFMSVHSFAQVDTAVTEKQSNDIKVALSAGNNIIQNGRKMNKNEQYIMPAITYFHRTGWYIGSSLVYMWSEKKPLDNLSVNTGYDKEFRDDFTVGIDYSYSKYFSTKQVKSGVPHTLTLYGSWYNRILSPALYAYYSFGGVTDITFNTDFTHTFLFTNVLKNDDRVSIPVIAGAYFGTLNFYSDYVKKNPDTNSSTSTTSTTFGLTSIFFSASIKYRIKSFGIGLGGTYNAQFNAKQKPTLASLPIYKIQLSYYF